MYRPRPICLFVICLLALLPLAAQQTQTPPIMPHIQETPLPPQVVLPPVAAPVDVPNRPLTATEAAQIALHHQPSILAALAAVSAAQGNELVVKSGALPSVSATFGNGTSYNYELVHQLTSEPTGFDYGLFAHQLLYDFNHTRDLVRQAVAQEQYAQAGLTMVQSDLVYQVKQAFYAYLQDKRLVAVNDSNVHLAQNQLALAEARLKVGVGLPSDVVTAQTAVADAILQLNLAQNTASVALVNLALYMGIDPRTPLQPTESDEPAMHATDLMALVNQGLKQRPEITQSTANIRAAQYGVGAAKNSNAPALVAEAGWNDAGKSIVPDANSLGVSVALAWDIFDSGLTQGRVKVAQANLSSALAGLTTAQQGVISDVSQAFLNLKTAEQRVVTAEAEVANGQEGVRLTTGRYQAGIGVFLDVLNAQTSLFTAQVNLVNAQSSVNQARAQLAHAINDDAALRQPAK